MIQNIQQRNWAALQELMAVADQYAQEALKTNGRVAPLFLMFGSEGKSQFPMERFADEKAKEDFLKTGRMMCVAHGIEAAVFVSDVWYDISKRGKEVDASSSARPSPVWQEMVIIMGETRRNARQRLIPVVRDANGKFLRLAEENEIVSEKLEELFWNFIPQVLADAPTRQNVRRILEEAGIVRERRESS